MNNKNTKAKGISLKIRLPINEYDLLKEKAEKLNLTMSDYLRVVCFNFKKKSQ